MCKKGYVLGVDVGATKSNLAVFTTEGSLIHFQSWGPLNHEVLPGSFQQLEKELSIFIHSALETSALTLDQIGYAVFGLAGADTKEQHNIISQCIQRIGFEKFTLCNDAFLGIPAANSKAVGICAINGTGCTVAGIDSKGVMLQIGGLGAMTEDLGGGGNMGRQVVAQVYRALFRKGAPTILSAMVMDSLGVTDKYDFIEVLTQKLSDGSTSFSQFNFMLFQAAEKNDLVALQIFEQVAENYVGAISFLLEELDYPVEQEVSIVLAGSVFVRGEHPALINFIKAKLAVSNPHHKLNFITLQSPPVSGAVVWALKEAGFETSAHTISKELESL